MTDTTSSGGTAAAAKPAVRGYDRRWLILALLCLVQFMLLLDDTVVNVALPSIQKDLGFSQENLAWVINSYVLVFGGFLLLGGRLADIFGRRRLFVIGTGLFAVASLLNGLAQNEISLICFRALQGLGGALAAPAALSMIAVLFSDPKERARALGFWGALTGLGGTTGVLMGGVLTDLVSWRWIFLVNVPIALIPLLLVPRFAPENRRVRQSGFDLPGAIIITVTTSALVYGLLQTVQHGWGSSRVVGSLVIAAVLFVCFLVLESRVEHPIVPLHFFKRRRTAIADLLQLLMASANFGTFFLLTLYLQQILGYSPLRAGVCYLGFFVGIFLGFGTGVPLVPRLGVRPFMVGGMLLLGAGMFWFARVPADGLYWTDIFPGFVLMSIGIAWTSLSVTIAGVADVPEAEIGLASGILNASTQVGGAIGLAILVTLDSHRAQSLLESGKSAVNAQLGGTHYAFFVGGCILMVAAVIAALTIGRLKPAEMPEMVVIEEFDDVRVEA